jgi:hypothetical protein
MPTAQSAQQIEIIPLIGRQTHNDVETPVTFENLPRAAPA